MLAMFVHQIIQRSSHETMEGNQTKRRIRLKCRYDGEIRIVTVSPETEFTDVKRRLSADYGFDVSLKYEDRDGDMIILASQNDLDDVFLNTETETINVTIAETLSLPNLLLKGTGSSSGRMGGSISTLGSSATGMTSLYNTSNVNNSLINTTSNKDWPRTNSTDTMSSSVVKSQSTLRPVNGTRLDRFPNIADGGAQYKQQEIFNIRWKKGEMLGQGAFGVVYLGLNIDSGELMAVKQMATEEVSKRELSSLENEIHLLRNLRHPNIVRYIGTELNPESMSIFLEYVPGGSLKALIDKFGQLEESVAKSYTRQLLIGLEYLHRHGIAHRDIKGANCLVGNDGVIKLADFGNSKHWRPPSTTASMGGGAGTGKGPGGQTSSGDIKGTPSWMAPEVIRDEGGSISWRKADIWSLACTTLEMTTGKAPWRQFDNPVTILYHIACQDTLPDYPSPASFELITFLNTCLQRDPKLRPDITSLLMHPFVSHMVLPPGMSASSNWAGTSGQAQYGNRPSTVSHAVVGEWDSRESSSSLSNSNNTFHRDTSGGGGGREAAGSGRDMRERTLPVSTFYSTGGGGQGQAQLGQGQQREVAADNHTTAVRTTGASRHTADSHVPQIFTLELPTAMPTSARGQQHQTHVNTNSNTNTAEDPELMLEVDHSRVQSRTHSRVPSMDVDFAQLSSQTTPRFAQQHNQSHQHQQVDAGVPGRGALPNRLVALANTNTSNNVTASPSSARSLKGAGNLKAKQQSPVNTSATAAAAVSPSNGGGGGGGGSSGGGSGSKSALHKRNKRREQAARESTTDSPFNTPFGANPSTTAALGAMEAQLAQLISHPTTATAAVAAAGMKSGEKADPSEGQEAHFEHSVPSVNEDEIDTPPNTISIPKLNIHHLGDGSSFTNIHSNAVADQSRMADLFHKELLAAAEADPYLRTNLEYPSSNYPSSRSNRSTTGAASSVQGGNKNPQQQQQQQKQRKQKASKKQPRTRLRSDFSSFDSEDTTSGWHHNASATTGGAGDGASVNAGAGGSVGREYEMDADSVTGGADDDTLYSADMLAGYSSAEAEGVLEESTPVPTTTAGSGIAQHGHQRSADRNSSSLSVPVLSHANSNVTTASANSPVNPVVLRGVKSAFNAIQQGNNSSMQYSDFKKVGGQSTSSGFSAESSSKGVLRPNFSKPQVITGPVSWKRLNNSRSQTELAVEDVSTPTAGATTATAAGGGSKGGTSVIKPTSLQTAPSGWRRQDKRERDQASLASTAAASASAAVDAATAAVSATTVTPTTATTTTAGSDMQDGQYLYEGGLSKARSYSGLGIGGHGDNSSLDGYNSTAEEIPDESHMMLHEDSTIAPSAYNPAGLRHSQQLQGQGQTQAQQTQQRRSQVQKAHNRQQRERERERERERDRDIQLDSDIADMTTLMNITGTSFDQQARTSTAATSASGLQLQHLNASLTGSLVLGTPSAASSARTGGSLKSSLSRRTLEVVSTPTVGASRNGSRQPLRTANRMHREKEKDTDKDTADPLDISCDSLDKLQIMGTAAATNSTRAGDREGTAKISTGTRQQSRRGGTNTAGGSRRNEEQPTQSAHLAQAYSGAGGGGGGGGGGNANLSMTSVDDEPEVVNSLFSAPPTSLDEHTAAITRLRAPERTNLLLSSSLDGTIRIWGPDSGGISDGGTGSRAVLEATGFKSSDNAYGAFADQRPERRITLGGDNNSSNGGGDSSSVTGTATGTGTARSATVKISNMWVDEACETIWAACSDAAMRVWSGGEGRPLRLLKGHEDQITAMEGMDTASSSASHLLQSSVSGNPTTCMMATGSADRTVRVWDVRAKKAQVFSFRGHGDTVLALRWGEGGRSLVSAAKDKTVRIWDTRAGRLRVTLEKHFGSVSCIRVLPAAFATGNATTTGTGAGGGGGASGSFGTGKIEGEGASVVSAGRDSMINIWSSNGDCLSSQAAHRGTVSFLSDINTVTPGGGYGSYGGYGGNGAALNSRSYYHCPLSSNPLMLSLGTDGAIKMWDMKRFRCISEINPGNLSGNFTKAVWCNTGFVVGSNTGVVRLYENSSSSSSYGGGGGAAGDGGMNMMTSSAARESLHSATGGGGEGNSEFIARSGSGSPGALAHVYAPPATAPSVVTGGTNGGGGSGNEWCGRDLALHSSNSGASASASAVTNSSQSAATACTDLICTDSLLASGCKSGQILRWSR